MVLALEEDAKALGKAALRAEPGRSCAELRSGLNQLRADLDATLVAFERRLVTKAAGLLVVQLGLFWAITRL